MLNDEKKIGIWIKRLDDPEFDFETVLYNILAKLKKNNLMNELNLFQKGIVNYINKEWDIEKIPMQEISNVIVNQSKVSPHYQKISKILTDEDNFYLQSAILGMLSE